jgi:predicted Zn finger-like uncharacterized protein
MAGPSAAVMNFITRITCPRCQIRYDVPTQQLHGRMVRCFFCETEWIPVTAASVLPPPALTNAAQGKLLDAAAAGDILGVKGLLAAKGDVEARRANGSTALIEASVFGHLDVVLVLLASSANVNVRRDDGHTALSLAALTGRQEIVRALLAAGAM